MFLRMEKGVQKKKHIKPILKTLSFKASHPQTCRWSSWNWLVMERKARGALGFWGFWEFRVWG